MANNPIFHTDPNGDVLPAVVAGLAVLGGVTNLYINRNNITSTKDALVAFGIGAAAGTVSAFTGGAGAAAFGSATTIGTTIASAAAAGAAGLGADALLQTTGNAIYFGNASLGEAVAQGVVAGVKGMIFGAVTGGALAGLGALTNSLRSTQVWDTSCAVECVSGKLTGGKLAAESGVQTFYHKASDGLVSGVSLAAKGADDVVNVFRVYGGKAKPGGFSWTPVNPNSVGNFRNVAGLPNVNTGRFAIEGTVKRSSIIKTRSALTLDGNKGGLLEYIIDPKNVNIRRVSGINPQF